MLIIYITQKLQKEIGIELNNLVAMQKQDMPLDEWYAHMFVLDRKKQLIFVEAQTLFSFSVDNVLRKDVRERLPELFEKGLAKALYIEGANGEVLSKIVGLCRSNLVFAKTESRKTIGAMNEFVKQHKFSFFYQNRPVELRDHINMSMPMHGFPNDSKDYGFPINVFAKVIKKYFGLDFVPHKEDHFDNLFKG